ncbi:hypothetical protein SDJN03_14670, partial [Cucurbita argyrosperma subsp. sororia]
MASLRPPSWNNDIDGGGLGVEAVFDKLFNGGHRPLNGVSGSDSIDDGFAESEDLEVNNLMNILKYNTCIVL